MPSQNKQPTRLDVETIPFLARVGGASWGSAMGDQSRHYRKIAADHLRKARQGSGDKEIETYLARGYKFLAHDAELHDREPEKSRVRSSKKKD
jgi:hypothetical protein